MKLKKWKKIILIAGCVLILIAAVPFSVFWFSPYPRHFTLTRTPLETDRLFSYPDSILCYVDGKTYRLTDEEASKVYNEFWMLLGEKEEFSAKYAYKMPINESTVKRQKMSEDTMCIEFRYKQRRVYSGNIKSGNPVEYDALLILVPQMLAVTYLDCTYQGTLGSRMLVTSGSISDFEEFIMCVISG